jgi:hypothetical protein
MAGMKSKSSIHLLQAILQPGCRQIRAQLSIAPRRGFRCSINQQTDGVYKALTEMRVRTPWIEALRQNRDYDGEESSSQEHKSPSQPVKPDLTPKRMSDSYFKCVGSPRFIFFWTKPWLRLCLLPKILGCLIPTPIRPARFAWEHY